MEMIGCYLSASVNESKGKKYISGPLFTVGKLNEMGWRLDEAEAKNMATSLIGKPVRHCKCNADIMAVARMANVAPEHGCDVANIPSDVARVVAVTNKVGLDGKSVWYAEAEIADGVDVGGLPTGWSVFGTGERDDSTGYASHAVGSAISLTNHPAYDEARTAIISASKADASLAINNNATHSNAQSNMVDGTDPKATTAPTAAATTNQTTQQYVPPVSTTGTIDMSALKNQLREELKPPTVDESAIAERVRTEILKEETAKGVVQKMLKLGTLSDDKVEAKLAELKALDLRSLEIIKSNIDVVPSKPRPEPGIGDTPLAGQASGVGGPRVLEEGEKVWAKRLGIDEATWLKYNPARVTGK